MIQNLTGKKGLVIGIANEKSIAWGCAQALHNAGADLAITYLNDKAKPYVEPLAKAVNSSIFLPYEATTEAHHTYLFETITREWGTLDFLIHSIAFAPHDDLKSKLIESSRDGFLHAVDVSCHSFIRLARSAETLMPNGGTLLSMSYYGAEKVIPNYNLMGPLKALLESSSRYLAHELGYKKIRVNVLSPGPIATRAASGLQAFDQFIGSAKQTAPLQESVSIEDVGAMAAFLISDAAARITGECIHIDAGYNIMG